MRSIWILGLGSVLLAVGCGGAGDESTGSVSGEEAAAFTGIYQLTAISENASSCESAGTSTLASTRDKLFFINAAEVFGQKYVLLVSCNSVSDCQAKRAAQAANKPYSMEYTYTLTSVTNPTTLAGFQADTGFSDADGTCSGRSHTDLLLMLRPDHGVRLEAREKHLADKPQQDGFCVVEPASSKQEAASLPCAALTELEGSFLQAM